MKATQRPRTEPVDLSELFPAGVLAWGADPDRVAGTRFPEEEAGIAGAHERRLREFRGGRSVARQVLDRLGLEAGPIPRVGRRPLWPEGVVGSIAHTRGFAVAVASRGGVPGLRGVGIDVERSEAVGERLFRRILTDEESAWVAAAGNPEFWGTVFFSAKEAFYKALAGTHDEFVGFRDVRLGVDPVTATFRVFPITSPVGDSLEGLQVQGRFRRHAQWIITGVTVLDPHGTRV